MPTVRNIQPCRTYNKQHSSYRAYKPHLRQDFNRLCGYCGENDYYMGGSRGFHIDHFRPTSKFSGLETRYENLVYACPFCNIAKSNDWPGDGQKTSVDGCGYVEPCDIQYEEHLTRKDDGRIRPLTELGSYMFYKLNLGLRRKQHVWLLDELRCLIKEVLDLLKSLEGGNSQKAALKEKYFELTACFLEIGERYRDELA